MGQLKLPYESI